MPLPFHHPLGDEEKSIREKTSSVVTTALKPYAAEDDEKAHFRRAGYEAMAQAGLTRVSIPREAGGLGLPYHCYYAMMEETARVSAAMAVTLGVTSLVQGALLTFGTPAQQKAYLPRLLSGEWIGAFSLSEPGSGSDAASLITSAVKQGKGYSLNGTKMWCSSAGQANLYLLMARTSPDKHRGITAFLIEGTTPGFRVSRQEKKLGLRASPLAELSVENMEIAESQRIGAEGEGLKVALSQLDFGRVSIGAIGSGLTWESLEILTRSCGSAAVLEAFADHYAHWHALRLLITEASRQRDQKERITPTAAMVKLLGSDLAMQTTSDALSVSGTEAYRRGSALERMFRDAKALQIVEGTNQIQRSLLAREMAAGTKPKTEKSA